MIRGVIFFISNSAARSTILLTLENSAVDISYFLIKYIFFITFYNIACLKYNNKHYYSFDQVVKTTILLDDLANFNTVNTLYGEYFPGEGAPARETYQVAKLPKGVAVEISCIAVK